MDNKFTDLEGLLLTSDLPDNATISERVDNLSAKIPRTSICAIGGFPVGYRFNDKRFYLLSMPLTEEGVRAELCKALGLSGMLTFANKSDLTLTEMGEMCVKLQHYWGLNFITVTILFNNVHPNVQKAFLRDKQFYESWTINNDKVFSMTGTIKDFKKFIVNKDDVSFDVETRSVLNELYTKFNFLWL